MGIAFEWLNSFLETNVAKVVVIPTLIAFAGWLGYLLKRWIEKPKPLNLDEYADLHKALTLKEKLDQNQMSLNDLRAFRADVLSKPAQAAVMSAEHYIELARRLADSVEVAPNNGLTLENASNQLEMNEASAKSAETVDKTLSRIVGEMLTASAPREREALIKSQGAWAAWRDAELARSSILYEGGSILPLVINSQHEAITRERIASLQTDMLGPEAPRIIDDRLPTPTNLLEHVMPGTPVERMRKWLGAPRAIHGSVWIYRYIETQVQVTVDDKDVVTEIVIALVSGQIYRGTGASWGDFVLGEMSIADAQEYGGSSAEYRDSMRTQELFVNVRTGPPGAWSECVCGALVVHSGAGALAEVEFEWDHENSQLMSDPRRILVNWIGMPMGWPDPPSMYWFIEG